MNYCTECGSQVNNIDNFCGQCGNNLGKKSEENKPWIAKLCNWAKNKDIAELQAPHDYESLLDITTLDISDKNLHKLPEELFKLINLEQLLVSDNKLTELSEDIKYLTKLSKLDLSNNRIFNLSDEVFNLPNLSSLDLGYNYDLSELPDNIGNLSTLIELNIVCPKLRDVPRSITNLVNLKELEICDSTNINGHYDEFATWIYRLINNNCEGATTITDEGQLYSQIKLQMPIHAIKHGYHFIKTFYDEDTDQYQLGIRPDRGSSPIRVYYKDGDYKIFYNNKWAKVMNVGKYDFENDKLIISSYDTEEICDGCEMPIDECKCEHYDNDDHFDSDRSWIDQQALTDDEKLLGEDFWRDIL
jgi:hypothetical protein